MTCPEVLERLAARDLARPEDQPAADEHLMTCESCQRAQLAYAAIDRFYGAEKVGKPPLDLEARIEAHVAAGVPWSRRVNPRVLAGAGGAVLLVLIALLFVVFTGKKAEKTPPSSGAASARAERITSADGLSDAERARATELFDADFLTFLDALTALAPFYPEDFTEGPWPPRAAATVKRPAETADQRTLRMIAWSRTTAPERDRVAKLDQDFRALPPDTRDRLIRRWSLISWFPADERASLRRIQSRLAELEPEKLAKATGEIRSVAIESVEDRGPRWHALPFAKGLTGQELTAAERVLICR